MITFPNLFIQVIVSISAFQREVTSKPKMKNKATGDTEHFKCDEHETEPEPIDFDL